MTMETTSAMVGMEELGIDGEAHSLLGREKVTSFVKQMTRSVTAFDAMRLFLFFLIRIIDVCMAIVIDSRMQAELKRSTTARQSHDEAALHALKVITIVSSFGWMDES
jgi:hypothetical protein